MIEITTLLYDIIESVLPTLLLALSIIGSWLVFEKAGEKGWKAMIPFYSDFILFKIADRKKWFILHIIMYIIIALALVVILIAMLFGLLYFLTLGTFANGTIFENVAWLPIILTTCICGLGACVCEGIARYHLCKGLQCAFDLPTGIAVGLFFLPDVFLFVVGYNNRFVYTSGDGAQSVSENADTHLM